MEKSLCKTNRLLNQNNNYAKFVVIFETKFKNLHFSVFSFL